MLLITTSYISDASSPFHSILTAIDGTFIIFLLKYYNILLFLTHDCLLQSDFHSATMMIFLKCRSSPCYLHFFVQWHLTAYKINSNDSTWWKPSSSFYLLAQFLLHRFSQLHLHLSQILNHWTVSCPLQFMRFFTCRTFYQ